MSHKYLLIAADTDTPARVGLDMTFALPLDRDATKMLEFLIRAAGFMTSETPRFNKVTEIRLEAATLGLWLCSEYDPTNAVEAKLARAGRVVTPFLDPHFIEITAEVEDEEMLISVDTFGHRSVTFACHTRERDWYATVSFRDLIDILGETPAAPLLLIPQDPFDEVLHGA